MTDDAASKRQWIRSAVDFGALAAFAAAFLILRARGLGHGIGSDRCQAWWERRQVGRGRRPLTKHRALRSAHGRRSCVAPAPCWMRAKAGAKRRVASPCSTMNRP